MITARLVAHKRTSTPVPLLKWEDDDGLTPHIAVACDGDRVTAIRQMKDFLLLHTTELKKLSTDPNIAQLRLDIAGLSPDNLDDQLHRDAAFAKVAIGMVRTNE
jgi:hypothetical protein